MDASHDMVGVGVEAEPLAAGPLPADLKRRLDELTQDWRAVHAER